MTSCPAEEELVLHVEGDLDPRRADAVADHLVECEACRRLVGRSEAALRYALGGLADAERTATVAVAEAAPATRPPRVVRRAALSAAVGIAATVLVAVALRSSNAQAPSVSSADVGTVAHVARAPLTLDDEINALLARTARLAAPVHADESNDSDVSLAALAAAEARIDLGMDTGAARLRDVVERFPGSTAAREARARIAALEGGR
ncbi:MAG: hypothetical protein K8T90_20080 [Planctomycetes bacterium]|nr:hypothetical protein [Planctomycetota bacterium]